MNLQPNVLLLLNDANAVINQLKNLTAKKRSRNPVEIQLDSANATNSLPLLGQKNTGRGDFEYPSARS